MIHTSAHVGQLFKPVWEIGVHEEGGDDGGRIGQPGRLDHNVVELLPAVPLRKR